MTADESAGQQPRTPEPPVFDGPSELKTIAEQLRHVLTRDHPPLRRRWRKLETGGRGRDWPAQVKQLAADVAAANQRQRQRRDRMPEVTFDDSLPIMAHREQISELLRTRQTIVVAGETGSGKSTQLPKICLTAGFGLRGLIGHTQPRRIAARTISARLAEELKVAVGNEVGFKIRFNDKTDAQKTFIKLMTDGVLLAETQSDRFLDQYEVIILDEAHERSLNIDFLLGYLRGRLVQRTDMKLIITSATIDAERFSEHFTDEQGPAPIVEVSGRTFPVETRYRPLIDPTTGEETQLMEGLVASMHELAAEGRGDILTFLPTERDIRELARRLRGEKWPGDGSRQTEVLPLYARLSTAEQNRIFRESDYRRIVLATNVAESSLTVPGIRYVLDAGTARISRYSPRSKMTRLPIESVSQASANQRAGRCGRVAPGICIRLYDEQDFEQRDAYTTPEIRRTNLASVILQAKSLKLGEIEEYPFLDPPRVDAIRDGYKTLFEIQAIDHQRQLTEIGRTLSRMPVDPRIGRMILAGDAEGSLNEVLIIAAVLEIQDPRDRPHDKQQLADERHEPFRDTESDFIGYLKLWDFYHHLRETVSRSKLRRACEQNFLSYSRMREWNEIHRQLKDIAKQNRLTIGPRRGDYAAIHRALLAGMLSGVAFLSSDREYTGAGGIKLSVWPGSGLFRERKKWIMAAERVETSRQYARSVARVSPEWIEPLADHLVKRSYSDPHWSRKAGTVMAYEKVSLMGMPIIVGRKVPYAKLDPVVSRQLFIQQALVDQLVNRLDRFIDDNRKMREEAEQLAAKTRRRDYLLDDYSIYAFYDSRVPDDVFDVGTMRSWLRSGEDHRQRVTMKMEDFLAEVPEEEASDQFPDQLEFGSLTLPVRYNFKPGDGDDGVTISVPAEGVNQLTTEQLDWLVPGLFEERVIALIRSLPKSLRRNFVPVPDTARKVVAQVPFGIGRMLTVLAATLTEIAQERITPGDFKLEKLPDHLRMNIEVLDEAGKATKMSRELEQLRPTQDAGATKHVAGPTDAPLGVVDPKWHRDGINDWDFGELPASIQLQRGGISMEAYPALIDNGETVDLRLQDTLARATIVGRRGITRLYTIATRKSLKSQVRWLPQWDEVCVWGASLMDSKTLQNQLQMRIAEVAFLGRKQIPRDEAAFRERLKDGSERIAMATQEIAGWLPKLFSEYHQARLAVETLASDREQGVRYEVEQQLEGLLTEDFLIEVPWMWLQQMPRYLSAITYRIDRWKSGGQARDTESQTIVAPYWHNYQQRQVELQRVNRHDEAFVEFRWMLEELRVSLFAQAKGTFVKISPQRLDKQWQKVSDV